MLRRCSRANGLRSSNLSHQIPQARDLRIGALEGCSSMACVIYRGAYEQMRDVLLVLLAWTSRYHLHAAGHLRHWRGLLLVHRPQTPNRPSRPQEQQLARDLSARR